MQDLSLLSLKYDELDGGLRAVLHLKGSVILVLLVTLTDTERKAYEEEFAFKN